MKNIYLLILFILVAFSTQAENVVANSPDNHIKLSVSLADCPSQRPDAGKDPNCVYYEVRYKDKLVLEKSVLGLVLEAMPTLASNLEVLQVKRESFSDSWNPIYGETSVIPDIYNGVNIFLKEKIYPYRVLNLEFRLYNEGVAFRYHIPSQDILRNFIIQDEYTHFQPKEKSTVWVNYGGMQTEYQEAPIENVKRGAHRPLVFKTPEGIYAAILEANVDNYSRMMLDKSRLDKNTLVSALSSSVRAETPFNTSWKLILIGDTPMKLLENNYTVLNLNPPNRLKNTDWIKPGKIMREMTLSTEGGKRYVDFAVKHNIPYILYDGGWYGDPIIHKSDAQEPNPWENKIREIKNHGGLNLQEVVKYGKEKGVGVFLYLDRRVLERRMDYLLPMFSEWGVKGLKFGFVNIATQGWTAWLHKLVEKCAEYQLMVDVHDEYYPTGISRTLPNLLTQEGIRGNEEMPEASHNVKVAYTRMLAGAADYTPAYFRREEFGYDRRYIKPTPAHQLALPIIFYSPLQSIFWYDKPEEYQGEPEVEFWENMPTTWDEKRVIMGEMGEFIVIARRKGTEWFVSGINNEQARAIEITFDFLEKNKKYEAKLYNDDETQKTRTQVGIEELQLQKNKVIPISMKPSGGFAMWIKTTK